MNIFVLVILATLHGSGTSTVTQEFNSLAACESARGAIETAWPSAHRRPVILCLPKDGYHE